MEEWKEYKLKDICIKITDGSHSSPKGLDDGYPMFSVKDMQEYGFDYSKCKYVSYNDFLSLKQNDCVPQKGDVLVAKDGSYLKQIFVCKETKDEGVLSSIAIFRPNTLIDSFFLCYLLKSPEVYNYIANNCVSGSALPRIVLKDFKEVKLRVPSLAKQKEIVSILKSLDDKIEVNRKINENLEQQAQALFKSWFVDFEPFKNGEFIESELGRIPKGWRVGTVDDVCCFESGFAFKSTTYKQEGEYRLITIKNVQDGYLDVNGSVCLDELPAKMPQYCLLRIGDILLSLTGNVGRCCFVDEERLLLNQRVAKLKPRIKNNWGYIYTLFRNPSFKDRVVSIARGTAQANLSPIETSNMKIIIPIDKVLEDFSAIVDESYRIMINNMIESRRLAELRDTLLPKLMSGELKVNEIENRL